MKKLDFNDLPAKDQDALKNFATGKSGKMVPIKADDLTPKASPRGRLPRTKRRRRK